MGVRFSPKTREEEWDSSQTGRLYFSQGAEKTCDTTTKKFCNKHFRSSVYIATCSGFRGSLRFLSCCWLRVTASAVKLYSPCLYTYIQISLTRTLLQQKLLTGEINTQTNFLSFFFCFWKSELATVQSVSLHLLSNSARIGLRPLTNYIRKQWMVLYCWCFVSQMTQQSMQLLFPEDRLLMSFRLFFKSCKLHCMVSIESTSKN